MIQVSMFGITNREKENIEMAESANIGITFSEMTLAESATVVLYSDKDHGRSISFLPACHVSIIPKSSYRSEDDPGCYGTPVQGSAR